MINLELHDIGYLFLRLGIAYIYLHGVFMLGSTKKRRVIGIKRTSILFSSISKSFLFDIVTKLSFYIALLLMSSGSILILSGVSVKIGSFLLILFTIPAIIVHKRESARSKDLSDSILQNINSEFQYDVEHLANLSHAGHRSSGNKNYMLLAVNFYLLLREESTDLINIYHLLSLF